MTKEQWYEHLTENPVMCGNLTLIFHPRTDASNLCELVILKGNNILMVTDYLITESEEIQIKCVTGSSKITFKNDELGLKGEPLGKYFYFSKDTFDQILASELLSIEAHENEA